MKKKIWRKRILWSFTAIVVLLAASVGYVIYQTTVSPDWYRSKKRSAEQIATSFNAANMKLGQLQNWAQDQTAWPKVSARPRVETDPAAAPPASRTITLNEDELNAVLEKLQVDLLAAYGQYISDPYIALHDGHIIAAVKLKEADRVLSIHIAPKLDENGMLILSIDHLQAGQITVPRALWSSYTGKLVELLGPKVTAASEKARYEADGVANSEAVISGMSRLLVKSIEDKASDAVLFIPPDVTGGHWERGLPVKVTEIKVEGEALTITVVPLNPEEHEHLMSRLRSPLGEEPEPAIAGPHAAVVDHH